MKHILVYGTLRRNAAKNHNYNRWGAQKFIDEFWIYGYNLHTLGSYPAVCKAPGSVFVELHEVDDETFNAITRMEKNAGYEVHEIEVNHLNPPIKASLYAFPSAILLARSRGHILSGDWNDVQELVARSSR